MVRFGQLPSFLACNIIEGNYIDVDVVFSEPVFFKADAKFSMVINGECFVNDSCTLFEADEIDIEDKDGSDLSAEIVVVLKPDNSPLAAIDCPHHVCLDRAKQCTQVVTVRGKTRQCRNRSRRECDGRILCHYHK